MNVTTARYKLGTVEKDIVFKLPQRHRHTLRVWRITGTSVINNQAFYDLTTLSDGEPNRRVPEDQIPKSRFAVNHVVGAAGSKTVTDLTVTQIILVRETGSWCTVDVPPQRLAGVKEDALHALADPGPEDAQTWLPPVEEGMKDG